MALTRTLMNRVTRLASLCAIFIATAALGDRLIPTPTQSNSLTSLSASLLWISAKPSP